MSELRELLNMNFPEIIIGIVIILLVFKFLSELYDWFKRKIRAVFKKDETAETDHNLLMKHSIELNETKDQVEKLLISVENLTNKLDEMAKRDDESERRKLKDRIAQAYRSYHEKGSWTNMEREAFLGLIEDYESHGGKNSFVHDVCQPESYTWEIVD